METNALLVIIGSLASIVSFFVVRLIVNLENGLKTTSENLTRLAVVLERLEGDVDDHEGRLRTIEQKRGN